MVISAQLRPAVVRPGTTFRGRKGQKADITGLFVGFGPGTCRRAERGTLFANISFAPGIEPFPPVRHGGERTVVGRSLDRMVQRKDIRRTVFRT